MKIETRIEDNSGFTLIEILVVLALTALLATSFGYYASRSNVATSPRDLARMIAGEARSAAIKATSSQSVAVLHVDLKERTVSVDDAPPKVLIPVNLDIKLTVAEQLITSDTVGNIEFMPDGSSTGGEVLIGSSPTDRYSVRVRWLTGEITTRLVTQNVE